MALGLFCGVLTGALWALTFVGPQLVHPFSGVDLAISRYGLFGVTAVLLMAFPAFRPGHMGPRRWALALWLGLSGYALYFVLATGAVRLAGPAIPPLVIGLLPVAMAVIGNRAERSVPWRVLAGPLALIAAGLAVVNVAALTAPSGGRSPVDVAMGFVMALGAFGVWLAYGVTNAAVMRRADAPGTLPWTGLQGLGAGLTVLPLLPFSSWMGPGGAPSLWATPEGHLFLFWTVVTGIGGGWLATLCWAVASRRLPLALSAQLIVSETLFAILYGFLLAGRWPDAAEWVGGALIIAGAMTAVSIFTRRPEALAPVPA